MGYPPPPPRGGRGLAGCVPTYPPTLSIRLQRIGSRRLRHRHRQALRHRHRLGRCPRCCPRSRCTRHRTPRARRWRGWRLRSAGQSLNSCVQSSAENSWIQEKNAEKRKKNCAKKARHHQQRMSIMGYPKGIPPPPPPPPGGGGGSKKHAKSRLAWYLLGASTVPSARQDRKKDFCDLSRLRAKISSVNARSTLERK